MEDRQDNNSLIVFKKKDLVGKSANKCTPYDTVNSGILLGCSLNCVKNSIYTEKEV